MSSVRVLVVDDFEPWRNFITSLVQTFAAFSVVGVASAGLEAVQRAAELQPDLVILDICMPNQNGIEAARQIRMLAPDAKIVFLSQVSDVDVIKTAFRLGASGYVVKTDAFTELIPALDAVRTGKRFVSSKIASLNVIDSEANS